MAERSLKEQRREHRRALSRDQILDVAEEVFARNGFHDASLREIAELAEFSVGAVYGFFTGKEEIYRALFLRRAAEFMPQMEQVLGSRAAPLRQLLDLAAWQVGFFRRYPHFARLVLRGGAIAAPLSTRLMTRRSRRTSRRRSRRRPSCSAAASRPASCGQAPRPSSPGCSPAWSAPSRPPSWPPGRGRRRR
jgi:AcrR family transcriptional regulator